MKHKNFLTHITVFLICILGCNTQDYQRCRTPIGEDGVCISIKECEGAIRLLRTQGNNPEIRRYLQQSNCGFVGNTPKVCCQLLRNQITSPTPNSISESTTTPIPVTTSPVTRTPEENTETYQLLRPPHCGLSNTSNGRIVGGTPVKLGQMPWIAALGYKNAKNPNQLKWLCGGSLITKKHVLTAAHCVKNQPNLSVARLGELDLYDDDEGANPIDIPLIKATMHEDYNPTTFTNDIAILTLKFTADVPGVTPICLPIDDPLRSNKFVKYNALVAGWGSIYFHGPSSNTLQVAQLPVIDVPKCKEILARFNTIIDDRVLCTGDLQGLKDSCSGDSGGPLTIGRPEGKLTKYYQIGLVSYGYRCAEPGYPGVYTRTTSFIDWIERNLN